MRNVIGTDLKLLDEVGNTLIAEAIKEMRRQFGSPHVTDGREWRKLLEEMSNLVVWIIGKQAERGLWRSMGIERAADLGEVVASCILRMPDGSNALELMPHRVDMWRVDGVHTRLMLPAFTPDLAYVDNLAPQEWN